MAEPLFKLAVDGNEANVDHRVGSNVYAFELINSLYRLTEADDTVSVTVLLASPKLGDLPPARPRWQYQVLTPQPLWTQIALPIHLFLHRHQYDVLFTPGHYAPRISSVPYVSAVMDLAFLKFPDQFKPKDLVQLRDWTRYSVLGAAKVIAISQSTARDVIHTYRISPSQVKVVYPAMSLPQTKYSALKGKALLKKLKIESPYFLYVGTLQPRKNIIRLVEAFEQFCRKIASQHSGNSPLNLPQLVLAGKIGWMADETLARISASPFNHQIVLTGYVSEDQKQMLYKQAVCSVLVGLYEGFGIPPLESMALGTVPVVSNNSSLPEVVGKAGILVNPEKVSSIVEGLERALKLTSKDRSRLFSLGQRQVNQFSWEKSGLQVLELLKKVGQS